jgi:hypothetical protein
MSMPVRTAGTGALPTTVAATGTARSARAPLLASGWPSEADLLPVGYFHVVFTLPTEVADIAGQNKAILYDLLFRTASETMMTIAAEPADRFAWHWSAPRPNPKHSARASASPPYSTHGDRR